MRRRGAWEQVCKLGALAFVVWAFFLPGCMSVLNLPAPDEEPGSLTYAGSTEEVALHPTAASQYVDAMGSLKDALGQAGVTFVPRSDWVGSPAWAANDTTTYYFRYGKSTSYGSVTSRKTVVTGTTRDVPVTANLTTLSPNTTYYYQVVAIYSQLIQGVTQYVTTYGEKKSFKTDLSTTTATVTATVNPDGLRYRASQAYSSYRPATGIVVHNTANSNLKPTEGWEGAVRELQRSAVRGDQYWDIEYHFVIDPSGKVYEGCAGRKDLDGTTLSLGGLVQVDGKLQAVCGEHALGYNQLTSGGTTGNTIGIAFLGCFMNDREWQDETVPADWKANHPEANFTGTPSQEAIQAARVLIQWIVNQTGLGDCSIFAHRDVSSGKPHCPGYGVYTCLPDLRSAAGVRGISVPSDPIGVGAKGGPGSITVTAPAQSTTGYWQAYRQADWIKINNGIKTLGRGPGAVTYTVTAHTGTAPRTGEITVGGLICAVVQAGVSPNQPPTISSLTVGSASVAPQGQTQITVSASDPEGDTLTYTWSANGGSLSATNGPGPVTWTAPNATGTYTITVGVTDGKHTAVTRAVSIAVVLTTVQITTSDPAPRFTKGSFSGNPQYWHSYSYKGHSYIWTYTGGSSPDCWAEFRPGFSSPGTYAVYALFYADAQNSKHVPYTVYHAVGSTVVYVDEYEPNKYFIWREAYLGTWYFNAGPGSKVAVNDATGDGYNGSTTLNVDTIVFKRP